MTTTTTAQDVRCPAWCEFQDCYAKSDPRDVVHYGCGHRVAVTQVRFRPDGREGQYEWSEDRELAWSEEAHELEAYLAQGPGIGFDEMLVMVVRDGGSPPAAVLTLSEAEGLAGWKTRRRAAR